MVAGQSPDAAQRRLEIAINQKVWAGLRNSPEAQVHVIDVHAAGAVHEHEKVCAALTEGSRALDDAGVNDLPPALCIRPIAYVRAVFTEIDDRNRSATTIRGCGPRRTIVIFHFIDDLFQQRDRVRSRQRQCFTAIIEAATVNEGRRCCARNIGKCRGILN